MKPIIHKAGDRIKIPIRYNFKYKVKTPYGYEKPLFRQDNHYKEDLICVHHEDGTILKMTQDHRHDVDNKPIKSTELRIGMTSTLENGQTVKIINITKEKFNGIACDFTMPNDVFYANSILTRNCRLRLDLRELTKKNGSLFSAASNTGSIGVCTVNLPKIGYLSHSEEEFFQRLDAVMAIGKESLETKRITLQKWLDDGLFPYTKRYLSAGFTNHFSTIGLVGMNEMCRNYFRNTKKKDWNIATEQGKKFAEKVLDYMRKKLSDFQEETGNIYNLEQTPAESTAGRFAMHDKKKYPDIITAGTVQFPYYTNSCHLPVGYTTDPWQTIKHQESLTLKFNGGNVVHIFTDSNSSSPEKVKSFIKKVMEETQINYITYSPSIRTCKNGHGLLATLDNDVCPFCKEEAIANYTKKLNELKEKRDKLTFEKN